MHEKEQNNLTLTIEELQLLLEAMEDEDFFLDIPLALEGDEENRRPAVCHIDPV